MGWAVFESWKLALSPGTPQTWHSQRPAVAALQVGPCLVQYLAAALLKHIIHDFTPSYILPTSPMIKIYETIILPALYGCKTCSLTMWGGKILKSVWELRAKKNSWTDEWEMKKIQWWVSLFSNKTGKEMVGTRNTKNRKIKTELSVGKTQWNRPFWRLDRWITIKWILEKQVEKIQIRIKWLRTGSSCRHWWKLWWTFSLETRNFLASIYCQGRCCNNLFVQTTVWSPDATSKTKPACSRNICVTFIIFLS
jgi:hypothetical protein